MKTEKNTGFFYACCILIEMAAFAIGFITIAVAAEPQFPALDPPNSRFEASISQPSRNAIVSPLPVEWLYHKTADSLHPDANEQQMVWLMNRARANPTQEGIWLSLIDDPDVAGARNYFNVDLDVLRSEFDAIAAKPPAAFDVRLYNAAKAHSDDLIARDAQDHEGQFDRVQASGFSYLNARGNVFSYNKSGLYGHAGFNIDWGGSDGTGMQQGRGHRKAIMAMDGDYTNVGLAVVSEINPNTQVGPLVTTGNYCRADSSQANHYNRFIVGTVWRDLNSNALYDPGEGTGSITIRSDEGTYYAITADSGGYAIPILTPGTYTVTFSGSGLDGDIYRTVSVGADSVLLDLLYTGNGSSEPDAITGAASDITETTASLNGTVNANGNELNYYFEYGSAGASDHTTAIYTTSVNGTVAVTVSGLTQGTVYYYRLMVESGNNTYFGDERNFQTETSDSQNGDNHGSSSSSGGGGCFIELIHLF